MKVINLEIADDLFMLLNSISKETNISNSALIHKGIGIVLKMYKDEIISMDLRNEIDQILKEDKDLLDKLF